MKTESSKPAERRAKRRPLGRDRRRPMSPVAKPPSSFTVGFGRLAIVITVVAWAAYVVPTVASRLRADDRSLGSLGQALLYISMVTLLGLSATAYLFARNGALVRLRSHRRFPRQLLVAAAEARADQSLTVIVPSYREEESIIFQTLLSACIQEFPNKRVVLLIDDPPNPTDPEHQASLEAAEAIPQQLERLLGPSGGRFRRSLKQFEKKPSATAEAIAECAREYRHATLTLNRIRTELVVTESASRFTRDEVVGALERDLIATCEALETAAAEAEELTGDHPTLRPEDLGRMYRRLAWTFTCTVTHFQRKRYINLSHDANKAMNLNSYIGLMGHSYREVGIAGRNLALQECDDDEADVVIPWSDYVLTLDADSVLLPEYCLRLVHRMDQPAFANVAVIQTPYSAFPGGNSRMERIGGATTDIQHVLHQGMTFYGATFWVGANAILRRSALDDIEQVDTTGPWPVKRYISDNTVIEDTESSIDLVANGWELHNYNERLSYSATPPDFGSMCIQRERWANGGLLILPKIRYCISRKADPVGLILRLNYMASLAWGSFALLLMLLWPFSDDLLHPLVAVMALPYFAAMAGDLKRNGYKRTDVIRIYAFNLLMLPVNLVGSIKSIYQGITGGKIAFARTPKVRSRTTAPLLYVLFPYVLLGWSAWTTYQDYLARDWGHAAFAVTNAVLGLYGLVTFIGVRNSLVDIWIRCLEGLKTDKTVVTHVPSDQLPATTRTNWEEVLFYGDRGSEAQATALPPSLAQSRPEYFAAAEEQGPASRRHSEQSQVSGQSSGQDLSQKWTFEAPVSDTDVDGLVDSFKAFLVENVGSPHAKTGQTIENNESDSPGETEDQNNDTTVIVGGEPS